MTSAEAPDPKRVDLVYDNSERHVEAVAGDITEVLYTGVSREEFKLVDSVKTLEETAGGLAEKIPEIVFTDDVQESNLISRVVSKIVSCYRECLRFQKLAEDSGSEVISAQLPRLFKIEKLLKHGTRMLSTSQNWVATQQFLGIEQVVDHHVFRYAYIQNVHGNAAYLAKILINRVGDGSMDVDDSSHNFREVYEMLEEQGLNDVFEEEMTVMVHPSAKKWQASALSLSSAELRKFHEGRNKIVHNSPLFVSGTDVSSLPDEIRNTEIVTEDELEELTVLASRLHSHMVSWLTELSKSYVIPMVEEMVTAWFLQRSEQ